MLLLTFFSSFFGTADEDETAALSTAWNAEGGTDWFALASGIGDIAVDALPAFLETSAQVTVANDLGLLEGVGGDESKPPSELIKKYLLPALFVLAALWIGGKVLDSSNS